MILVSSCNTCKKFRSQLCNFVCHLQNAMQHKYNFWYFDLFLTFMINNITVGMCSRQPLQELSVS